MKVEVAHIVGAEVDNAAEARAGVWEAGPAIWPHIRQVRLRGYGVPVVPLEIQLETSLQRGLEQRVVVIVTMLKREGYDAALIEWGLSPDHFAVFQQLMVD